MVDFDYSNNENELDVAVRDENEAENNGCVNVEELELINELNEDNSSSFGERSSL